MIEWGKLSTFAVRNKDLPSPSPREGSFLLTTSRMSRYASRSKTGFITGPFHLRFKSVTGPFQVRSSKEEFIR